MDASLPIFLENDASAASLPKNASASLPLRATLRGHMQPTLDDHWKKELRESL